MWVLPQSSNLVNFYARDFQPDGVCKWLASQGFLIYMEKPENPVGHQMVRAIPFDMDCDFRQCNFSSLLSVQLIWTYFGAGCSPCRLLKFCNFMFKRKSFTWVVCVNGKCLDCEQSLNFLLRHGRMRARETRERAKGERRSREKRDFFARREWLRGKKDDRGRSSKHPSCSVNSGVQFTLQFSPNNFNV